MFTEGDFKLNHYPKVVLHQAVALVLIFMKEVKGQVLP